jgi:hypothetical protein
MAEQSETIQNTPVQFVASPDGVLEIYCNLFHINWTLFDIRIRLAQLVPTPDGDINAPGYIPRIGKERAALTLAWPEVKQLRDALIDAVARYEQANGEIQPLKMPTSRPDGA